MVCRDGLSVDVVAYRREQSHLVAELAEKIVEQCGNGCLAIGARHADQFQLPRRISEEVGRHGSDGLFRRSHLYVGHALGLLLRHVLAEDRHGTLANRLAYETVAIDLRALHGHEEVALLHLA